MKGAPGFQLLAVSVVSLASAALASSVASAQEGSYQPYIDQLKGQLAPKTEGQPESGETFLEKEQRRLKARPAEEGSYIEELKRSDPERFSPKSSDSYIEKKKGELPAVPAEEQSAIAKFKEGRSELRERRDGEINHAAGFRLGASMNWDVTANREMQFRSFNEVYGSKWAPAVTLFYEYQPFHSDWLGNVGLVLSLGVAYHKGTGQFEHPLTNARTGQAFPLDSGTRFMFFSVPVMVGLDYRFNLFRIVQPFVMAGPTVTPYFEARSDDRPAKRGYSRGLFFSGGASLLIDWLSRGSSWDLYAEHGIKRSYVTVEYSRATTLAGDVSFAVSGISAGMTFEF